MQSKLAIKDIYLRNDHHNYFQIKIVSHFSSKQTITNICHAYILNKLAVIPFQEEQKLTQLYKLSLEHLLSLPSQHFKNQDFVDQLTNHLCIWQERMNEFGSWPFTRAAFYSIEEKVKKKQDLLEKVILKRAILEPNKQQFLNKSMNQTFKNEQLIAISRFYQSNQQQDHKKQQPKFSFRDIIFQDSQNSWKHLLEMEQYENREEICLYLNEYVRHGLARFIKTNLVKCSKQQLIESLKRRNHVFLKMMGTEQSQITKLIQYLQLKQVAEKEL